MALHHFPRIVTDGLVLCLDAGNPLSYTSGDSVWKDLSGNDNNGTLINGPTYSSANGGGLVFDGVDNYISIPYTSQLAPTSAISFGAWTYLSDWNINFGTNGGRIISKTESGGYQMGAGEGTMGADNVGALLYINSSYRVVKIAKNLISSGWHYLLFTFDGQYFKMYLDGTLVDTYNHGSVSSIIYNYNNIVAIGAEPNGSTGVTGNYWNGNIALISIYNKALSANEVSQNFNATKGRYGL